MGYCNRTGMGGGKAGGAWGYAIYYYPTAFSALSSIFTRVKPNDLFNVNILYKGRSTTRG
jgi:hypothetical protein